MTCFFLEINALTDWAPFSQINDHLLIYYIPNICLEGGIYVVAKFCIKIEMLIKWPLFV